MKSFLGKSILYDFYGAFGQYLFYREALVDEGIEKELFLAISIKSYQKIIANPLILKRVEQYNIKFIAVDIESKTVEKWLK